MFFLITKLQFYKVIHVQQNQKCSLILDVFVLFN